MKNKLSKILLTSIMFAGASLLTSCGQENENSTSNIISTPITSIVESNSVEEVGESTYSSESEVEVSESLVEISESESVSIEESPSISESETSSEIISSEEVSESEEISEEPSITVEMVTVTFMVDNKVYSTKEIEKDTNVSKPKNPTKSGYTFEGWYVDDEVWSFNESSVSKDITLIAKFTINSYTITFDSDGGSEVASITQDYGTKITAPQEPVKEGYTFTGWSQKVPSTMPSNNLSLTAKWSINQYTITIDNNGGSGVESITQNYGTEVSIDNPTREGYTFIGWDNAVPETIPANDLTLTAQWKINQYTITIDNNGGNGIKSITQDYNTEVSVDNPTREGYAFIGWDKTLPETIPANDLTLTAKWELIYTYKGSSITGLTTYGKSNCAELDIPSQIDGNTITSIGSSAFKECSSLTSVTISNGITSIGSEAFSTCKKLKNISIPNSVTNIESNAFVYCTYLQYNTNEEIDYLGNDSNPYLVLVSVKDNTKTSYSINDNVKVICYDAFFSCGSLTNITIPNGVTSIGDYAFYRCTSLTSIVIPENVTSIGEYAFNNCKKLTTITISNSVTSIGEYALNNCSGLTNITFVGTIQQWKDITKGSSWNNATGEYTIHCTNGDIAK